MTKTEMKKALNSIIKTSGFYNEVVGRFAEKIMVEHLGIAPNSVDPVTMDGVPKPDKELKFKYLK